ncbi:DNA repair protein RadC [Ferruginibacter lapsinanis]|uniref:RadC family protein n=1 Tax=Ferruginibacter lapsinanis TaxID=563172 RepID=UPI001E4534A4|nr:DNA repair protein RadC [Ferruginibacter lapsinanis]UEG48512.1 DNA repair protein RadC [Ferruginibacter lapsinanis]
MIENFNKASTSIKNWAEDDRPREKLAIKGCEALSDSELLAILINNGTKEKSAVELAKDILQLGSNNLNELGKLSLKDFTSIKGIGQAKAITIAAALELGRRRQAANALEKIVVRKSNDIAEFLRAKIKDYSYEVFGVLFLNQANKINHFEIISSGGITGTVADPRIILKKALDADATSLVLCHNHPSGNLKPSQADEAITYKIKEAAKYFDIKVIDHIIVSEDGYYSFADEGCI